MSGLERLNAQKIARHLAAGCGPRCEILEVRESVDSTNARLLAQAKSGGIHRRVLLAEHQRRGRGRRGRVWQSPPAAGLYLSLGWHVPRSSVPRSLFSLMTGVAVVRAVREFTPRQVRLKWPNDVVVGAGKLGGILLEGGGAAGAQTKLVIGVGLNVRLPAAVRARINQPCADLAQLVAVLPSRNVLAAALIRHICLLLEESGEDVQRSWLAEWRSYDACLGKEAELVVADARIAGRVQGVDDEGRLLLRVGPQLRRFAAGSLSLRAPR